MSCSKLFGITSIEYADSNSIILSPKKAITCGERFFALGDFKPLNLTNLADLIITDEYTDNGLIYTTNLTGTLYDNEHISDRLKHTLSENPHVFRLTDLEGKQYLIGNTQEPHPRIAFTSENSYASSFRAVKFNILWTSTQPPINLEK